MDWFTGRTERLENKHLENTKNYSGESFLLFSSFTMKNGKTIIKKFNKKNNSELARIKIIGHLESISSLFAQYASDQIAQKKKFRPVFWIREIFEHTS